MYNIILFNNNQYSKRLWNLTRYTFMVFLSLFQSMFKQPNSAQKKVTCSIPTFVRVMAIIEMNRIVRSERCVQLVAPMCRYTNAGCTYGSSDQKHTF